MQKEEVASQLLEIYETYQYLMTKVDLTRKALDTEVDSGTLNDFELERVRDILSSAVVRHQELEVALKKINGFLGA